MADATPPHTAGFYPSVAADRVLRFRTCRLTVTTDAWPYAVAEADAIDRHWQRRSSENPALFNGVIHMLRTATVEADHFDGAFLRTNFKSYLYWREQGFPAAGIRDAFGSALLRSREGHVLLGRQGGGNLNAGQAYLPGGFIDHRDVAANGAIDIDGSILRELHEETALEPAEFEVRPGYIVTFSGPLLSIGLELQSSLDAATLRTRILSHIAREKNSELTDILIVRSPSDLEGQAIVPYAAQLLEWLFAEAPQAGLS